MRFWKRTFQRELIANDLKMKKQKLKKKKKCSGKQRMANINYISFAFCVIFLGRSASMRYIAAAHRLRNYRALEALCVDRTQWEKKRPSLYVSTISTVFSVPTWERSIVTPTTRYSLTIFFARIFSRSYAYILSPPFVTGVKQFLHVYYVLRSI